MAKPMKTLELHYPMIQFKIYVFLSWFLSIAFFASDDHVMM